MYRVLYRKWRPQVFSDVVGQEQVTTTLKNEVKSSRLSHAYLFVGSRGTGKTTCAKILSKAVNCLSPVDGDPCNECEICRGIDDGSLVDVVEIDAASNNGVDNIRTLREEVNYNPARAKYRVYIIDEVHMLSPGAYNALLKTLEEPPPHVIFILATTEVHKLPPTILSRCQRFTFNRINPFEIAKRVSFVAENESISVSEDAALLIARLADGAMRDALSILDQCSGKTNDITVDSVTDVVGMIGRDHIFKLANAIADEDTEYLIRFIDTLYASSVDMERLCAQMCEFFRNCLVAKVSNNPSELITASEAEIKNYSEISQQFTVSRLMDILSKVRDTQDELKLSLNRRVDMEMLLIELSKPKLSADIRSILARVEALERGTASRTLNDKPDDNANKTISESDVKLADSDLKSYDNTQEPLLREDVKDDDIKQTAETDEPFSLWPEVLEEVKKINRVLHSVMWDSRAFLRNSYILIDAPNPVFSQQVKKDNNASAISEALMAVTGNRYKIGIYKKTVISVDETKSVKQDKLSEFEKRAKSLGVDIKYE